MEIDHELTPFNIKKLVNNGHTTRVLFESEQDTFICEIIGPSYQQSPECQINIKLDGNEILKRDIYNLLKHLIFTETYQKQSFTVIFDICPPYSKAFNALYYAVLLHGIRIKDSFTSCSAFLDQNKRLIVDRKEKQWSAKLNLVYSINLQQILCSDVIGQFNNDDLGLLISGCISGCNQIYNFIKDL
ncbi:unnamed protein product [Paramecium primaurelia]|uniref:Uncharacterized protein n=1 Tax=Paramecium primaurelia TaxID=5886 RepID=A0A8S1JP81_PARPR|nr:unnamed protein product [Paramecium primaurelia]